MRCDWPGGPPPPAAAAAASQAAVMAGCDSCPAAAAAAAAAAPPAATALPTGEWLALAAEGKPGLAPAEPENRGHNKVIFSF